MITLLLYVYLDSIVLESRFFFGVSRDYNIWCSFQLDISTRSWNKLSWQPDNKVILKRSCIHLFVFTLLRNPKNKLFPWNAWIIYFTFIKAGILYFITSENSLHGKLLSSADDGWSMIWAVQILCCYIIYLSKLLYVWNT